MQKLAVSTSLCLQGDQSNDSPSHDGMNAKSGDKAKPQSTSIVKAAPKKSAIPMQHSSNKASVNVEEVDPEEESVQTFFDFIGSTDDFTFHGRVVRTIRAHRTFDNDG